MFSATQKSPHFNNKRKVHTHVHKTWQLAAAVHSIPLTFSKNHLAVTSDEARNRKQWVWKSSSLRNSKRLSTCKTEYSMNRRCVVFNSYKLIFQSIFHILQGSAAINHFNILNYMRLESHPPHNFACSLCYYYRK
jgi:hypothetical protein